MPNTSVFMLKLPLLRHAKESDTFSPEPLPVILVFPSSQNVPRTECVPELCLACPPPPETVLN